MEKEVEIGRKEGVREHVQREEGRERDSEYLCFGISHIRPKGAHAARPPQCTGTPGRPQSQRGDSIIFLENKCYIPFEFSYDIFGTACHQNRNELAFWLEYH